MAELRAQRRARRVASPRAARIECTYCGKAFALLDFAAHVATSGHRRNLALHKGGSPGCVVRCFTRDLSRVASGASHLKLASAEALTTE